MTILCFACFVGFKKLDSALHSCLIPLIIFYLFDIWPSLIFTRSHSDSFSDSFSGLPIFRRSMPYMCPSSDVSALA